MARLFYYYLHPVVSANEDENRAIKELIAAMEPGEGGQPPAIPIDSEVLQKVNGRRVHNVLAQHIDVRANIYKHADTAAQILAGQPHDSFAQDHGEGGGAHRVEMSGSFTIPAIPNLTARAAAEQAAAEAAAAEAEAEAAAAGEGAAEEADGGGGASTPQPRLSLAVALGHGGLRTQPDESSHVSSTSSYSPMSSPPHTGGRRGRRRRTTRKGRRRRAKKRSRSHHRRARKTRQALKTHRRKSGSLGRR